MVEPFFIVTNNPMSKEKFGVNFNVEYVDGNVIEVFNKVRDYVHKGHRILTHPLMSSIKPNETPYRTIALTKKIENSIMTTNKFLNDFNTPNWSEKILLDFQLIDYDLIYHAKN